MPALLAAWLAAAAAPVAAGPCLTCSTPAGPFSFGWRDEQPLSPSDHVAAAPRLDADEPGTLRPVVVWEDVTAGTGDIWIATTPDAGCSWDARVLTPGSADDHAPDVAVSSPTSTIVVVFVRGAVSIMATASTNGGKTFSPPERVDSTLITRLTSPPRVAAIRIDGAVHYHVVWGDGGSIRYARNLKSGAPGSWESMGAVSAGFSGFSDWSSIDVAADSRSADPARFSALTIAAAGKAAGRLVPEVFVVRSNDSGASFYGDPTVAASLNVPRRVSDPRPDEPAQGATGPVLDGSDDGSGVLYAWQAVAWTDARAGGEGCRADARAEEGSTPTVISDWNDPPSSYDARAGGTRAAGLAVLPNPLGRPPTPEAHLFFETSLGAPGEVSSLRGQLDAAALPTVDLLCGPYVLTGAFPPRQAGGVVPGSFSADEDLSDVYVAWQDDREAMPRIWVKRTDSVTEPPVDVAATPAECATGGGLEVTWNPPAAPPNCDVDHYLVEAGTQPGSYDRTVVSPGSPARLTGLTEGAAYYVRVTTFDQACNQARGTVVTAVAPICGPVNCPSPVANTLRIAPARPDARLAWEAGPIDTAHGPPSSYDVWRSTTSPAAGYSVLANPYQTAYIDGGAATADGPDHYYRIVARNACGTSGDEPPQ